MALRELAAAVKPASVDSILATYGYPFGDRRRTGKRSLVDARVTKKHYTCFAVAVLSCLVTAQAYWFAGTTLRADLETHRAELDGIAGSLRVRSVEILDVLQLIKDKNSKAPDALPVLDFIKYDPTLAKFIADLDPWQQLRVSASLDFANKIYRSHRVIPMIESESATLQAWAHWDILRTFHNFATRLQLVSMDLIGAPATARETDEAGSANRLSSNESVSVGKTCKRRCQATVSALAQGIRSSIWLAG